MSTTDTQTPSPAPIIPEPDLTKLNLARTTAQLKEAMLAHARRDMADAHIRAAEAARQLDEAVKDLEGHCSRVGAALGVDLASGAMGWDPATGAVHPVRPQSN